MDVKMVCDRLVELLGEQGGGCVDTEGKEVFPFDERIDPSSAVEVLWAEATARELRGAVWRLTHSKPFAGVWAVREGDELVIGYLPLAPSLEGSLNG